MRILHGRRFNDDIFKMPKTALVRKAATRGPCARHDLDRFLEPRLGLFRRNLKALEFAVPVALADTEVEATMRQEIESRGFFSEQDGIVPRRNDHRRTEPQYRGAHCERSEKHQGRGKLVPADEGMLDRET